VSDMKQFCSAASPRARRSAGQRGGHRRVPDTGRETARRGETGGARGRELEPRGGSRNSTAWFLTRVMLVQLYFTCIVFLYCLFF